MMKPTPPRLLSLVLGTVFVLALWGVQPAGAVTCSTVSPSCEKGSSAAATAATNSMKAEFSTLTYWVEYYIEMLVDRVVRVANTNTQDSQSQMTSQQSQVDTQNVPTASTKIAETRAEMVREFVPSVTTCAAVTRNFELGDKEFSAAQKARYDASQAAATNYASNDPAGPSGKGAVAAGKYIYNSTLTDFCDPAILQLPAATCTQINDSGIPATADSPAVPPKPMGFRYAKPFEAVFSRNSITDTTPESRAARLYAQITIEPVPSDPIRNQALTRSEGKNLSLKRYSDMATINLARGAIDRMIDERLSTGAADKSLQQLRQEAWNSSANAYAAAALRARNGEVSNIRDIAPLVLDQNRIYLQIYLNLERLAAIKAAHLARTVKQNGAAGSSSAGSAMKAQ